MARCHRIGQTKPVVVYRLCTKGTIDEAIINRSDTKRILEKAIISKEWTVYKKDSLLKLQELMKSKDYEVVTSKHEGKILNITVICALLKYMYRKNF